MTSDSARPDVGRRLSAARLQRGLSQGTVARLAGVAPSYLSRIERGKIQPTFRTLLRLVHALRADIVEIVGPEGSPGHRAGACPLTEQGSCLLDLVRPADAARAPGEEAYSPREIRLLRTLALWLRTARPDRLRAMEVLLEDLTRAAPDPRSRRSH